MSAKRWPLDVDASEQGERVRFCLGCGEVMAYSVSDCPKCGHENPSPLAAGAGPSEPCPSCGESRAANLLYCPACGAPSEEEASFGAGPLPAPTRPDATGVSLLSVSLAWLAPLFVLLSLLYALGGGDATGSSA